MGLEVEEYRYDVLIYKKGRANSTPLPAIPNPTNKGTSNNLTLP